MNATMMDFPLTLTHILERAGRLFPEVQIISRMPDRSLHCQTYAEFYRRARALAEVLLRMGVRRGDRVATLMWNHRVHLEAYFGIPAAGGIVHTLNLRLAPSDLAYIANHAEDRFLIVDDVLLPLYEKFRAETRFERVVVVSLTGQPAGKEYQDYEELLSEANGELTYPPLDEREGAAMCYTSGTTGRPKGVVYSHRALVLHSFAASLPGCLALTERDVVMPVVPMFHANAWGIPFAAPMMGAKLVLPGPYLDPESVLDLAERTGVTLAAAVPTVWMGIADALEKFPQRRKLAPGMRLIVGGTAPPEALIRRLDRQGLRLMQAWGLTESTPVATICHLMPQMESWDDDAKYAVRALQGRPVPFVELRAVGAKDEVPWDGKTPGELQLRGPWIASGYCSLSSEQEKWTEDGWFRTGDIATIDSHGYVRVCDRTKDLIKSGGEWISSVDLENALMAHPSVAEAAVVAVPHPKWQERPLAIIVLREGAAATPEEFRGLLSARFAKWQLPDAFVFVPEIPHTTTGKMLKAKLREQYKDWEW
jgi:acyl-CoA synthetase (AMP-forming)/AMP-acid ligase II